MLGARGCVLHPRLEQYADTVLGCTVGLVGGLCLHSPRFRAMVGRQLRRLAR